MAHPSHHLHGSQMALDSFGLSLLSYLKCPSAGGNTCRLWRHHIPPHFRAFFLLSIFAWEMCSYFQRHSLCFSFIRKIFLSLKVVMPCHLFSKYLCVYAQHNSNYILFYYYLSDPSLNKPIDFVNLEDRT